MPASEAPGDARVDDPEPVDTDPLAVQQPTAEWVAPPPYEADDVGADDVDAGSPWYRTAHSRAVLGAVSLAVVALVVSVVLLAFRETATEPSRRAPAPSARSATPTTTATAPESTSELPPPPQPPAPPPPPPPPPTAIQPPPVVERPQPTRKPEINVTRNPMSVSPKMPKRP